MDRDLAGAVDELASRYPTKRAALLPALWLVQERTGWVSAADLAEVARRLGLAPADAEGVASFYFLFHRERPGLTVIDVCDNFVCRQNGSRELIAALRAKLGIEAGQTTADGRFTLRVQECLAACHEAPAVQVNLEFQGRVRDATALLERIGA